MIRYNGYLIYKDSRVVGPNGDIAVSELTNGYKRLYLSIDNKSKSYLLHRLIVEAFLGEIPKNMVVHHIDHDITNCALNNLLIVTQEDNLTYSGFFKKNGLTKPIEVKIENVITTHPSITAVAKSLKISASVLSRRIGKGDTRSHKGIAVRYLHADINWDEKGKRLTVKSRPKYLIYDMVTLKLSLHFSYRELYDIEGVTKHMFDKHEGNGIDNPSPTLYIFKKLTHDYNIVNYIDSNYTLTYKEKDLDCLPDNLPLSELSNLLVIEEVKVKLK